MTVMRCNPRSYSPFSQMNRLFSAFPANTRTEAAPDTWRPAVDVTEDEAGWTVEMDLPGVPRENVKVTAKQGALTIEGEKPEKGDEDACHAWSERPSGTFHRRFTLPEGVDVAKVSAEHKDGVLRVTLPKSEVAKPTEIEVAVA
jgi:HSP20 family protein